MLNLIYRQNKLFVINSNELPLKAKSTAVINGLYADIYSEFYGASQNEKYKELTNLQKMEAINSYAAQWLKDKGFL